MRIVIFEILYLSWFYSVHEILFEKALFMSLLNYLSDITDDLMLRSLIKGEKKCE